MMGRTPSHAPIPDTQSEQDHRQWPIHRVGIRAVRHPVLLQVAGGEQPSVGTWQLDVALPAEKKGTHMSRFLAWLGALGGPLTRDRLIAAVPEMLDLLDTDRAQIDVRFPFFIRKRAPVSGLESLLDYEGQWQVQAQRQPEGAPTVTVWAQVAVPVKSLCPCSKEISDYGAHNQRSCVTVRAELLADLDWRDLVRMAEESASCEIWPVLKRADEKWVTERAYENPKFVEDLVRDVAVRLQAQSQVGRFSVDVENFESIHNHSAWAQIVRD